MGSDEYNKVKIRKMSAEADLEIAEICKYKMVDMLKFKRKQVTRSKQQIMLNQVKY